MNVQTRMTAEADAAAQRYGMLVEGWRSLYQRALASSRFGSDAQIQETVAEAYELARTYLATEKAEIESVHEEIASEALTTTLDTLASTTAHDFTDAMLDHLSAIEHYLATELTVQIERDIAFLQQSLRRSYLQVHLAAQSQRIPRQAALMQYRIGNAVELHFFFHDRGSQKWPSRKFVRSVWRHSLLATYNEIVLLALSDHGLDQAEIAHLNPSSTFHGQKIAMHAGSALPIYAEIRDEIFHPNSDAVLAQVQ